EGRICPALRPLRSSTHSEKLSGTHVPAPFLDARDALGRGRSTAGGRRGGVAARGGAQCRAGHGHGRRHTVALGLLLVLVASGATAVWVAMPVAATVVFGVAGLGGALVSVYMLPLVFDRGADTECGMYTGLAAVPVQAAAVVGPSVAGLVAEATGSQRTLFGVAAVAIGVAWLLLQRVQVEAVPRSARPRAGGPWSPVRGWRGAPPPPRALGASS